MDRAAGAEEETGEEIVTVPKAQTDAFDVSLSAEKRLAFTQWLCSEIDAAQTARSAITAEHGDLDYYHWCYEQGRSARGTLRWEGAADLASYIITEKVDAMRARMAKTIFVEPVWTVEGWGADAQKAAFCEEFHQWKLEEERLQSYITKTLHLALVEGNGILEIIDRAAVRLETRQQRLSAKLAEDGSVLLDERNRPIVDTDDQGVPIPAGDDGPAIEAAVSKRTRVRIGPGYRVISLRDFLYLPGHAADKADLFGALKRIYVRMGTLQEREKDGTYQGVSQLSTSSDRDTATPSLVRSGQQIADQTGATAEKELWEGQILADCDEDGVEEWYIVTVHLPSKTLLRLKKDDLGLPRYHDFCPFPRPDSLYGYSYAGHKLLTLNEEHTAIRNMIADRSTLATTPPILRMQGALWDPQEQPFGTGRVIDVRSMDEIQPLQMVDVPPSAVHREAAVLSAAERVSGQNDIATGATSGSDRTLGERQMQAESSFVRVEEPIKHCQETMEDLFLVRNEIWIRTLEAQSDGGMPAPERIVQSLQTRGLEMQDGKFTASMLRGNLRGKPRGSVETADKGRMRNDFNASISALAGMAKMNPVFAALLQHPTIGKELLEQWARLYSVSARHTFMQAADEIIAGLEQAKQQQAQMAAQQPPPGMMAPGQPPGPGGPQPPGQPPGDPAALLAQLPPELQAMFAGGAGAEGVV